jgi:hypothetical protein
MSPGIVEPSQPKGSWPSSDSELSVNANSAIDLQRRVRRFCTYRAAVLHPQSFSRLVHAPRRFGLARRRRIVQGPELLHDDVHELVGYDDDLYNSLAIE